MLRVSSSYGDVWAKNQVYAYQLAYLAGGSRLPVGPEVHKDDDPGYYYHYHPYARAGSSHVFFAP